MHTPEKANGGQIGRCAHCKLTPTIDDHEVYDGCLGKLKGNIMNACCGHGDSRIAYIQYWDGKRISGVKAISEQKRLIAEREK